MKRKIIIIAEAGVNHNGKMKLAKKLIVAAKKAGADYVKFQLYNVSELAVQNLKKANYQKKRTSKKENQYQLLEKLALTKKQILELYKFSQKKKIGFLISIFDLDSLKIFKKLKTDFIKIPSGEINNIPLLYELKKFNKPIILSTGMANLKEISNAMKLINFNKKNSYLLHCISSYPTEPKDINLKWIDILKKKFKCNIGLSDHTKGLEAATLSVALGSKVIEKHLTLNKHFAGPDHLSSLEPKEFKNMVNSIRISEEMMKFKFNKITRNEKKNMRVVRKSIVASKNIKKGDFFSKDNLTVKRPGNGLSPNYWFKIQNKKSPKNFKKDQFIKI